ncbi:TPA: restriction endonuclease subunit S [Neisseria lactamica]|uniref:Putative Type I restriction-modification system DNA methylase n=1 Tax=Neisseria lactamica (strain 020-06) TaxID=489653 RepID=E4ZD56_NEIL0|nr:restriction endonuclease subunit S [Neisseria lactamica]CBN87289.1 putative Type I restriction-modification system DNA methylase [Neisseria lactamica 020-06]
MKRQIKIGEIAEINANSLTQKDMFQEIMYLDTGNITRNEIDNIQILNITMDKIPSRAKRKVKDKTIIYSTVRPNQEHYGFLENPSDNFIVSTGFSTIDVYDDNTDEKFIYYLLTQKHITDYLHTIGENSVSSYPSINPDDIANLKFTVPDLKTQQSIAAVLSALDKKIALNKQINARLEEMAKTLYDYWFVQFDFPDANSKPYKSSGGEMVFDETLKREIPKGWKPFKLSELVTLSTGKEDANFATEQGIYPFFTCSEKILKCDVYSFDTQAILLAGNGTFSVKRFTGRFNAYQRTYVLEPKSKNLYPIVYFVIIDNVIKFTSGSRGSIIKFITRGDIEHIDVVLPNDIENMRFSEVLYTYLLQAELLEKQNYQLTQLRDFLLPMLMNGQVSVAE